MWCDLAAQTAEQTAIAGAIYGAEVCLGVAAAGFLIQAALIAFSPVVRIRG